MTSAASPPGIYYVLTVVCTGCAGAGRRRSQHVVELVPDVGVVAGGESRVAGHQGVLAADVERVVHFPVDVAHLPRRVEQALAEGRRQSAPSVRGGRRNAGPRIGSQQVQGNKHLVLTSILVNFDAEIPNQTFILDSRVGRTVNSLEKWVKYHVIAKQYRATTKL